MEKPRKVLYHPLIEPDLSWLKRILLLTDEVVRIVPHDLEKDDSEELKEFCDAISGALTVVRPTDSDINLDDSGLARLSKAFGIIAATPRKPNSNEIAEYSINYDIDGELQVNGVGYGLLHNTKFSHQVKQLLLDHNLIQPELKSVAEDLGYQDFEVVEKRASDLILSVVADNIASRNRCDTITDNPLSFTVTSLNALREGATRPVEAVVIECLLPVALPANVSELSLRDYIELRKTFQDIRALFHQTTLEIVEQEKLDSISKPEHLRDIIPNVAQEFADEMESYRNTAYAIKLGSFKRAYFSNFMTIVAAAGAAALFSNPVGLAFAAGGAVAVGILGNMFVNMASPESTQERLVRRLCSLEKNAYRNIVQAVK